MKHKHLIYADKRLYGTMLVLSLTIAVIIAFGLTLPFNKIKDDAVLGNTVWYDILLVLIDLFEIAFYAVGTALFLFTAFYALSTSTLVRLGAIYAFAILFRYFGNFLCLYFMHGSRLFWSWYFEPTLLNSLPYLLLDLLFLFASVIVARYSANRYIRKKLRISKPSVLLKDPSRIPSVTADLHPFKKIFNKSNPLQLTTLILGILLSVAELIASLSFDLTYKIEITLPNILSMIGGYLSDLLVCVIFYIFVSLLLKFLFSHQNRLIINKNPDEVK